MRLLLLLSTLLLASIGQAQPRVVATIMPIHSITAALMQGVAEPELLIPATSTPHHFSLRPSQRRSLEHAGLIIWVGEPLEGFMPRILHSLPEEVQVLGLMEPSDYEDPHIWLDPIQTIQISAQIRDALIRIDPEHAEHYRNNAEKLKTRLKELDHSLDKQLTPVREQPFIVFHNAYGYMIERYNLTQVGSVTLDEHHQPGGRHLQALRKQLLREKISCLFTEPQFEPAIVDNLIRDTQTRTMPLDPMGIDYLPGPDAYFHMMETLGDSLSRCLSGK
jgi:zinc transport system substrate-binding protein